MRQRLGDDEEDGQLLLGGPGQLSPTGSSVLNPQGGATLAGAVSGIGSTASSFNNSPSSAGGSRDFHPTFKRSVP